MKHLISVPPRAVSFFHDLSGLSPEQWFVSSDPGNARVGSGGGTAHLLTQLWQQEGKSDFTSWLSAGKRVIIHAGGKSRRLPAYAPLGKSLMPMPVFRWSRGQDLGQRLIHLQTPLFDKILERAPASLNTLVASGDVLIFPGKHLPEIPEADIVLFGMWIEPEKAANHGVFFAPHHDPQRLSFMLQKPSADVIQELIHHHYFLMDIGIWLLGPRAVEILMKRCGWESEHFRDGLPGDYDLYSTFGTALGTHPHRRDDEIGALSVALVNLEGGAFYHIGNTPELVDTNMSIQNRVTDQREIWHRNIKPHPSIFVLNSRITNRFTSDHRNIWVENAVVPDSWQLTRNHALTGIPENEWTLTLEEGSCLDMVPTNDGRYVVRGYGYDDKFSGRILDPATRYMNRPLQIWLASHRLALALENLDEDTDIQELPLFPVLRPEQFSGAFLEWLFAAHPASGSDFSTLWLTAERVSADDVGGLADLAAAERQRRALHRENIPVIAANHQRSVFYQLDLRRLASEYNKLDLDLPPVISSDGEDWTKVHDSMFRAAWLREKGLDGDREEKQAFSLLREGVLEKFRQQRVMPAPDLLTDQIAWGRSPVRFDIAGGWTDTPPYCMRYGGRVVNVAAELNGQPPLHCYIRKTKNPHIVLRSIDLGAQEVITTFDEIRDFHHIGSPFSIPRAALALTGFLPEFCDMRFDSLEEQLKYLGGGLEISILAAVPKGSGLGTSSILAATVLGTLADVCHLDWDKRETGSRTLALEQLLTTGGGWQDQYGGLLEGIKLLESTPGKLQMPEAHWLPEALFAAPGFKSRLILYYTGITRVAKSILADIVRGMFLNSASHLAILDELKQHAAETRRVILRKDFDGLGRHIHRSWELNQSLDPGTNTPEIQQIIDSISPYITGQKLLGAGGGGYMLIVAKDEEAAVRIRRVLTENPVYSRARLMDFNLSTTGFQVTRS